MNWLLLKNAREEIVSIRDSFKGQFPDGQCKLLCKYQVVVGQLPTETKSCRYVHVAPLGAVSGLANRPAEWRQDDGKLTLLEGAEMGFGHVDMVALLACDTRLGRSTADEGLLGLQRASHMAGDRSMVVTLWTIRDDASRQLMIDSSDILWKENFQNTWKRRRPR